MSYKPLLLVLPILCILTSSINGYNLMLGTIQFPKTLETIPNLRIYHSGKIISGKVDSSNKTVSFSIPKYSSSQIRYSLIITESIEFASPKPGVRSDGPGNIIEYIKVPDGNDYKLYTLLLVPRFSDEPGTQSKPSYNWRILQDRTRLNNKIPDDAIIVLLDPNWIENVQGENAIELPTIKIRSDVVELSGSAQNFYDKSTQLLLAAIDSDTMHDPISNNQTIKQEQNRVTIAAPVA